MRSPAKASSARHVLDLVDRGPRHRHRWVASCSCGWHGIPLRLQRSALAGFDGHVPRPRRRGGRPPTPQPVTPPDKLPAELVIDLRRLDDDRPMAYGDRVGGRAGTHPGGPK